MLRVTFKHDKCNTPTFARGTIWNANVLVKPKYCCMPHSNRNNIIQFLVNLITLGSIHVIFFMQRMHGPQNGTLEYTEKDLPLRVQYMKLVVTIQVRGIHVIVEAKHKMLVYHRQNKTLIVYYITLYSLQALPFTRIITA